MLSNNIFLGMSYNIWVQAVINWFSIQDVFLHHTQCDWERPGERIHHSPQLKQLQKMN